MNKIIITFAAAIIFMTGCTSTVVLGPKANPPALSVTGTCKDGVNVVLPFVRVSTKPELDVKK